MQGADVRKLFAKLDEVKTEMVGVRAELKRVAANSQLVVAQVQEHGGCIDRLEGAISRLKYRCPMFELEDKPQEGPADNGSERLRPSSSEYAALDATTKKE